MGAGLSVIALAGWLARHPFSGIIHDNRLYAAQALHYEDPTVLGQDLFFKYGSQDAFTLFSPLYGTLIRLFGLGPATELLMISGQVLWLLCGLALIRAVLPHRMAWLSLLVLATYPAFYGGNLVFSIAEGFVTPRLFSEALSMGAIAAFLGKRLWLCVMLLAAAALLHPLMAAAPVGAMILATLCRGRPATAPAVLAATATALLLVVLALLHGRGAGTLAAIDAPWRLLALHRSPQLFIGQWTVDDWISLAGDVILVMLAALAAPPPAKRLFVAAAAVSGAGIAVSLAGFDLLDDLLIGQLQLWRAAWLLRVLAPIGLVLIISDVQGRHGAGDRLVLRAAFAVCVLGALGDALLMPVLSLPAILVLAMVYLTERRQTAGPVMLRLVSRAARIAILLLAGAAGLLILRFLHLALTGDTLSGFTGAQLLLRFLPPAILLAGLAVFCLPGDRLRRPVLAFSTVLLCLCALNWDRRDAWRRYIDSGPDIALSLALPIGRDEAVYWPGNVMAVWAGLKRQSYYSSAQGAGLIFNRQTAMEFLRRLAVVRGLEPKEEWHSGMDGSARPGSSMSVGDERRPDVDDLRAVCGQAGHPDVIVLDQAIDGPTADHWHAPVAGYGAGRVGQGRKRVQDFYLYRCADKVLAAGKS